MTLAGKTYRGVRRPDGATLVTCGRQQLPPRHDLRSYGPVFDWDASEAGPSQLALALLADYLGDDQRALDLHQDFRRKVIRGLPAAGWVLGPEQIEPALREIATARELKKLERQMGFVLPVTCHQCRRHRVFCAPERSVAEGHALAAGWVEVVDEDESVYRLCPECHEHPRR